MSLRPRHLVHYDQEKVTLLIHCDGMGFILKKTWWNFCHTCVFYVDTKCAFSDVLHGYDSNPIVCILCSSSAFNFKLMLCVTVCMLQRVCALQTFSGAMSVLRLDDGRPAVDYARGQVGVPDSSAGQSGKYMPHSTQTFLAQFVLV